MRIFATPDFGASLGMIFFLLIVWGIVLTFVLVGIVKGIKLLRNESPKVRKRGFLLVLASGLIPLGCCLVPSQVVRLVSGNYPLGSYPSGKIQEGMSEEEVKRILGPPQEQFKQDENESWYYWIDSFGIFWFGVRFGPDGRVVSTYGN